MPQKQKQSSPELTPSPTGAQSTQSRGKISCEDIQLVQNLIERCLLLYMTKKDVVQLLQTQARVEPNFTSLVWMKLEEQNPEFFKAYYTRLKLKTHINTFNQLLQQQAELMKKMGLLPTPIFQPAVPQVMPAQVQTTQGVLQEGLQAPARSDADMEMAAAPVGELNTNPPENMFNFGAPADIPGMGLDTNFGHHDAQGMESLPTDGDAMNTLGQIPRNFSLSDLTDLGPNGRFPRNFSLTDLTADLGPDFGGLGNFTTAFVSEGGFLQSPERDGFDEDAILEFGD